MTISRAPAETIVPLNTVIQPISSTEQDFNLFGPLVKVMAVVHLALGPLMVASPVLSTIHAGIVVLYTIYAVMFSNDNAKMLGVMGYISGVQVLWRMGDALIPWMLAEYLLLFIIVVGIARRAKELRFNKISILYVLLLLPSCLITLFSLPAEEARQAIIFNLLGLVTMGIGLAVFSGYKTDMKPLLVSLLYCTLPLISTAAVIYWNFFLVGVEYGAVSESNEAVTSGYGPNQVSNALSFGATALTMLLVLLPKRKLADTIVLISLTTVMILAALLTLSRGGIVSYLGFLAIGMPFLVVNPAMRVRAIVGFGIVAILLSELVLPQLNVLTKGALQRRYADETTTHRSEIIAVELDFFAKNPVLGIGAGKLPYSFPKTHRFHKVHSHTEYSRLLAEHGISGVFALLFLLAAFFKIQRRSGPSVHKGMIVGCIVWILIFFSHSATRIIAFAYLGFFITALANHSRVIETPVDLYRPWTERRRGTVSE